MRRTALLLAFGLCACAHSQVQVNAGAVNNVPSPPGTHITSSQAGLKVQSSGANTATAIGLGIFMSLLYGEAYNDGVHYRANPFIAVTDPAPARAPELAPGRRISEQDCTKPVDLTLGNLRCK